MRRTHRRTVCRILTSNDLATWRDRRERLLAGRIARPLAAWVVALSLALAAPGLGSFDPGAPILTDLWIDRAAGDDARSGATRAEALRTVAEAWNRIPAGAPLSGHGYRLRIVSGSYSVESGEVPLFWNQRHGTAAFPVWIVAADGPGTVTFVGSLEVADCSYLLFDGIRVTAGGGDAMHFQSSDHLVFRHGTVRGADPATYAVQEAVKVNQVQHLWIEDSDLSGGWNSALDLVAVQHGEILRNHIHDSGDWCVFLKGGSADFRLEGNEIDDCDNGGFTAGQGTGFEFMVSPWLHFEAYDLKFVNNVVHDVGGAGVGANGAYNLLVAYNSFVRVGRRSHLLEVGFGTRVCNGDIPACETRHAAGGWGLAHPIPVPIPNRNVQIVDNVFYNPAPDRTEWIHFSIAAPQIPDSASGVPSPASADDGLRIRGNVIWNGPADHPLGVDASTGCAPANPLCNPAQLLTENSINREEPQLVDPAAGDFHPRAAGNLFTATVFPLLDFPGDDRPSPPLAPLGDLTNRVSLDRDGQPRPTLAPPGAFASANGGATATCLPDATTLCLGATRRFRARVAWTDHSSRTGVGQAVTIPSAADSGLFWFFGPDNLELLVKVLDGCTLNHRYWVFTAFTTDVGLVLTVEDTATGALALYENPRGRPAAPILDTSAFATCP